MRAIGLMSGTSVDGIDVALVELEGRDRHLQIELLAADTVDYPPDLRQRILEIAGGAPLALPELADLDDAIAEAFARAAIEIQEGHHDVELIGSHGQTVYHQPPTYQPIYHQPTYQPKHQPSLSKDRDPSGSDAGEDEIEFPTITRLGYSLQLGRGTTIAQITGLPTVSNFRAADLAAGGQGAPLVPRIDACLLGHVAQTTCIQNLGGIGNVTYVPRARPMTDAYLQESEFGDEILGWDTGPGNLPIDLAVRHFSNGEQTYDRDGAWAASGEICEPLVDRWLTDPFFALPPPKSTGREYFGSACFQRCLDEARELGLGAAATIASLTELTAASVSESYRRFLPALPDRVLLCGGGSRNTYLCQRLQARLGSACTVQTTDDIGIDADSKEAIAFAVLAYWRWHDIPGNLPSVTGAARAVTLGELHFPALRSGSLRPSV